MQGLYSNKEDRTISRKGDKQHKQTGDERGKGMGKAGCFNVTFSVSPTLTTFQNCRVLKEVRRVAMWIAREADSRWTKQQHFWNVLRAVRGLVQPGGERGNSRR